MSTFIKTKIKVALGIFAVVALSSAASAQAYTFTYPPRLQQGSTGTAVMELQKVLNMSADTQVAATGVGSAGMETSTFGPKTKAAVMKFQAKNGLAQVGSVGPATAAALNAAQTGVTPGNLPAGCTSTVGYSSTTGAKCDGTTTGSTGGVLGSGEGDLTNIDEVSSKDATLEEGKTGEMFAFTAEVEGDVKIDRVDVYAESDSAASENADDYFKNASLWINGAKVATVNVSDFNEDDHDVVTNDTTDEYRIRFTGLNSVFKDGDEPKFVVAFEANSVIDSADQASDWTVALDSSDSIRFVDGRGFSDSTGASLSETFGFDSEEMAEISINSSSSDVDATTIKVSDSTTTTASVFVFEVEEENDVDVTIEDLTVTLTTTGTTDESAVVETAALYKGSTELGSESVPNGGVVTFENLGLDIDAGDTEDITLKLTFADVDGYTEGSTVTAVLTSIDDARDANGNDEGDMTINGEGLSSETHELRSEGISVALIDTSSNPTGATKTFTADAAGEDDQGTFEISFAVTAFGADMYIDNSSEVGGGDAAGQGVEFMERDSAGTPVLSSNLLTSSTTDVDDTANTFKVKKGKTRNFTLTVIYSADSTPTDGSVEVYLESINWGTATNDTNANYYTFDLGDYKTGYLFLNGM